MSDNIVRLMVRGFLKNVLVFAERVDATPGDMEKLAVSHMAKLYGPDEAKWGEAEETLGPHMIEIEFLDEPDREQRFIRLGTDTRRMVNPWHVDPRNPEAALKKLLENLQ